MIFRLLAFATASVALTGCYRTTPPIWLSDLPAATQSAALVTEAPKRLMGVDGKPFEVEGKLVGVEIEEPSVAERATFEAPIKAEPLGASVKISGRSGSRVFPVTSFTVARLEYSGTTDRAAMRNGGTALIVGGIVVTLVGGVVILAGVGQQFQSGSETMLRTGQAMAPAGAVLGAVGAVLFVLGRPLPATR